MLGQNWTAKGKTFELFYLLYVGDGAFNFTNQNDMIKASKVIRDTMTRLGLIMHIGVNGGKLKTEAMYYPPMDARRSIENEE